MAILLDCVNHQHYGYITVSTSAVVPEPEPPVGETPTLLGADPEPDPEPEPTYEDVTRILIKRRMVGGTKYQSVFTQEVSSLEDLNVTFNDFGCRNNYEYFYVVQYFDEYDQALYSQTYTVKSYFDCMVLADGDKVYYTPMNFAAINPTRIKPYVMNTPLYSTKPSYYCNTMTNYEEATCQGTFLKATGDENHIQFDTTHNWEYRKEIKDWLTIGNAKLLKNVTGEMWIIAIKTDSISDTSLFSQAEVEGARLLEFGWFEVGEADSESDLYDNNLINVPSEYWSGE